MARWDKAEWLGDNLPNKTVGHMYGHKGLVLHCDGSCNIDADNNWFHNPSAEASAHFGIRKDGSAVQWVDTDDTAWAEMGGNHYWVSVENECNGSQPLTQAQEETAAHLFAWLHKHYGFVLQVTSDVDGQGLGHHSMGGADWGNHLYCPGQLVIEQKPYIAHRARAILDAPAPSAPTTTTPTTATATVPDWYHRELQLETPLLHGDDVKHVQRKVGATVDGFYGEGTKSKVKGWQTVHKLTADGIVGKKTAEAMG